MDDELAQMDDDLKFEISTIISLANGDPQSLLPNLFARPPEKSSPTPEVLPEKPEEKYTIPKDATKTLPEKPTPKTPPEKPTPKKKAPSPPPLEPLSKRLKLNNFLPLSKNNRKYLGMKGQELLFRIQGDKVIEFCQENGLIAKEVTCHCGKQMQLRHHNTGDGFVWMCRHAKKVKVKQTIRKGTWFEKSNLKIGEILWLVYMWVHEYSVTSILHECDQSSATITSWCQHCINVCQGALESKTELLGGIDKSVEIFECTFKKGSHHRDSDSEEEDDDRWAFCGIEQYSSKSLLVIIEDKESQSVMEIFDKYFVPGTTVVGTIWCALTNMNYEHFQYLREERAITFYDQVKQCQLDDYKDFKKTTKRPPPGKNKWNKMEYGPRFFEKMTRKSLAYATDAYLAFLKDVSLVYKPSNTFIKRD